MPAIQPPPVPSAAAPAPRVPPPARSSHWFAAVDAFVFTIYRTGFVQSLILHVAVLLLLALIVVRPDLPRQAALALDFTAAGFEPEPDVAALAVPAPEPEELEVPEDAAPVPESDLATVDLDAAALDAVEPAMFAIADQPAGPAATDVFADLPASAVRRLRAGGAAGGAAGGGGAAIGGEIGRRLTAAGAGTGDVQISIAWSNVNDIDLHVLVEPLDPRANSSIISFMNRVGIAGGCLDVDRNVWPTTRTPVENVFWGRGAAPFGRYTVAVHHYRDWGGGDPTEVEVVTLVDGEEERFYVVLRPGDPLKVVTSFRRAPKPGLRSAGGGAAASALPRRPAPAPARRGAGGWQPGPHMAPLMPTR